MFIVHRAERTGELAAGLAALLRAPLADPFATEVVAVPARGVERWLTQQLAGVLGAGDHLGDGICAGVDFPSPRDVADAALADAALAAAGRSVDDPWSNPVWPLLATIDDCLDEPWCTTLAAHLGRLPASPPGARSPAPSTGDDHRRSRRYAAAAKLARLFRSYAAHRPEMLRDWAAGRDTDGETALAADLRWQAELWRRLRDRIGPSPAELLAERCATLRAEPALVDLPDRFSLFGPTRLPADQLAVLDALSAHRDVHLWLPHPSPALWATLQGHLGGRRSDRETATVAAHPLLRSMARDVRELQLRLPPHDDRYVAGPPRPDTLLGRLQDDLRADRAPAALAPPAAGIADGSVAFHSCHGPARQVEVLREVLLRLFEDDPTLEPRDVLVMCPDVETFAPLVSATFGLGADLPHPGHQLRVRLADRGLRQTNPLLDLVATLLTLAGGRVTASQVLSLAATAGVRARFGFDDDDLRRLRDWVAAAGIRWGLDAEHRAPFGMERFGQNTWRAGLDRILLGVAAAEDEPVSLSRAVPLDDVDSSEAELAGRAAELLDRLQATLDRLQGLHPAGEWADALFFGLDQLTATTDSDAWQLGQARREIARAVEGSASDLRLPDVRAMLRERLAARPTRSNFRTGALTVCTMVPMRSVPHRVVVLLGLDDGVFPRTTGVDGDDVLARDPRLGERDPASEDRQLLLDAVASAEERLLVLFTGADPVTGAPRPPAVPVSELIDTFATLAPGAREALVVHHPLQPFDPRSFTGAVPFSFDRVNRDGARAAVRDRVPRPRRETLPARPADIELQSLLDFVDNPAKAFFRQRLGLLLPGDDDEVEDGLRTSLDSLQEWAIGDRLLRKVLEGAQPQEVAALERLRGTLPPGPLGREALNRIGEKVMPLVHACSPHLTEPPRQVDLRFELGPGRWLSGTIGGVRDETVVNASYSSLGAKQKLRGWVLALALRASGEGSRSVTIGRWGRSARTAILTAPPDPGPALAVLAALYDAGMREPLPLAPKSSEAYSTVRLSEGSVADALEAADNAWRDGRYPGECADVYNAYAWGEQAPLSALTQDLPAAEEARPGEPSRFGALSLRLWEPIARAGG